MLLSLNNKITAIITITSFTTEKSCQFKKEKNYITIIIIRNLDEPIHIYVHNQAVS